MPKQIYSLYTQDAYNGMEAYASEEKTVVSSVAEEVIRVGQSLKVGTKFGTVKADKNGGNIFGVALREDNHEAETKPADSFISYRISETVSVLRQGTFYAQVIGTAAVIGVKVSCRNDTAGGFSGGTGRQASNITWMESGAVGDIILARIDIVN